MKKALIFCVLMSSAMFAENRPEVGRYTQAYSGDEGIQVYVTRLGSPEKAEVLLMISHVDHPLDGVIRKARVENTDRGRRYFVDKEVVPFMVEGNGGSVYLPLQPNNPRTWNVKYDAGLSNDSSPEHLLTRWLESGQK